MSDSEGRADTRPDTLTRRERAVLREPVPQRAPTPKFVRQVCRQLFEAHLSVAVEALQDPQVPMRDKLRALDLLAKVGVGTTTNITEDDGTARRAGVILLPAIDLAAQQQVGGDEVDLPKPLPN
jgi:hypothetical protein